MSDQQPVGSRGEGVAAGRIIQETNLATVRALLDTLSFYAMLVDSDHRIVVANKAVLGGLGREPLRSRRGRYLRPAHLRQGLRFPLSAAAAQTWSSATRSV